MKRIFTITLFTLISFSVFAKQNTEVKITDLTIKESDNKVSISFDAFVPEHGSNYMLTLTPVLYNDPLGKSYSLLPIVITGKNKAISLLRENKKLPAAINGKAKQKIPYSVTIPYESWMSEVSLKIIPVMEGCCAKEYLAYMGLVSEKLIRYDAVPVFKAEDLKRPLSPLEERDITTPFLYSFKDYPLRYEIFEKQREKGALVVYFEQGKHTINRSYKGNQNSLKNIQDVLDIIYADSNATLKKIVIVGLTSPEGTLAKNDALAQKRASSVKYFVGEHIKYNPDLFEIFNGSEDWDGLKKLVEKSNMPNRWDVLDILERYPLRNEREKALMKLNGGATYRYMTRNFFPQLRNAGYVQMYYDVKPDPEAESLKSVLEFMESKQYDKALSLLLPLKSSKPLENIIGVCYMMTGDYEQAESYFERAIVKGNSDALTNLKQVKILQSIK